MDLKNFIKTNFQKDLREIDLCVKGWNWGEVNLRGSLLSFNVDKKPSFEVPLKEVSKVRIVHVLHTTYTYLHST